MSQRASCWSVTINNPTPQDEEYIALARQRGWKVEGQLEKGEQGTVHYQLVVRTPQVRFSQVKKAFPRGHIEPARNASALTAYVHKNDTRLAELPESQERFPSLSRLWELIFQDGMDMETRFVAGQYIDSRDQRDNILLNRFDDRIRDLIRQGYHVETMGVNPQLRSAFLRYGRAIQERIRRQTDRQTAQEIVVPMVHNHAEEEELPSPRSSEEEDVSSQGSGASDESPF